MLGSEETPGIWSMRRFLCRDSGSGVRRRRLSGGSAFNMTAQSSSYGRARRPERYHRHVSAGKRVDDLDGKMTDRIGARRCRCGHYPDLLAVLGHLGEILNGALLLTVENWRARHESEGDQIFEMGRRERFQVRIRLQMSDALLVMRLCSRLWAPSPRCRCLPCRLRPAC